MPRDLFGVGATPASVTRAFNRYTVVGSALLHIAIVGIVLIVPLLASDILPKPNGGRVEFVSPAFIPPNPPMAARPRVERVLNHDAAPVVPPHGIRDEEPAPPANAADSSPFSVDITGAQPTTGFGPNIGDAVPHAAPAPPPTPPVPQKPLPIGGAIRQPTRVSYIAPIYPPIAMSARIEGDVVIQAIIGTDGTVQDARVMSGSPLLSDAALSAVRQWRYTPTLLNTQPVAVIMTVTVTFRLQH